MPHLLALSRELRDLIYSFVLDAPDNPPPSSPAESGERQQLCRENVRDCIVYCLPRAYISSAALLPTNGQIHAELSAQIARLKKAGRLRYKLDCMPYEEEAIYLTWLSVPALSSHVDVLEVDLRLFGDPGPDGDEPGSIMSEWTEVYLSEMRHFSHYSPAIKTLCALLKRFLIRGPDMLSRKTHERKIKVECLVLNVIDGWDRVAETCQFYERYRDDIIHSGNIVWEIQQAMKWRLRELASASLIFETVEVRLLIHLRLLWNASAGILKLCLLLPPPTARL